MPLLSHTSIIHSWRVLVSELLERLPKSLREARAPVWRLLDETIPAHLKDDLHRDLFRKHSVLP